MRLPSGSEIYLVNRNSFGHRRLTISQGDCISPRWSPSGKTISYIYHGLPDESGLMVVSEKGQGGKRVAQGWFSYACWGFDDNFMFGIIRKGKHAGSLVVIDISSAESHELVHLDRFDHAAIACSKNANNGLFLSVFLGSSRGLIRIEKRTPKAKDWVITELDSGDWGAIAGNPVTGSVAALKRVKGVWSLHKLEVGSEVSSEVESEVGSKESDVLFSDIRVKNPYSQCLAWSPDGLVIAFLHEAEVYRCKMDGSTPVRLTTGLLEATRSQIQGLGKPVKFVAQNVDASRSMAALEEGSVVIDRLEECGPPNWDPQDEAVGTIRDGQIFIVNSSSGRSRFMTKVNPLDKRFSFSNDGEWLAYSKVRDY